MTRIEMQDNALTELEEKQEALEQLARDCRDTLIELLGKDGKGGMFGMVREEVRESAKSQGERIEKHTADIATLKQTRAVLLVLGGVAMLLIGALATALLRVLIG